MKNNCTVNLSCQSRHNQKIHHEELWQLIKHNPGITQRELGKHFGCSQSSIHKAIKNRNIPYQSKQFHKNRIDINKLRTLIHENPGYNLATLVKHFDCTIQALDQAVKKHNIPYTPPGRKRKIDIMKLRQYINENPKYTLDELARHFDCTSSAISQALKRSQIVHNNTAK